MALCGWLAIVAVTPLPAYGADGEGTWRDRVGAVSEFVEGDLRLAFYEHFDDLGPDHLKGRAELDLTLEIGGDITESVSYKFIPVIHCDNYGGSTKYLDRIWEKSNERYTLNLEEAYVTFASDNCDLRIGKQVYSWGYGDAYNPTDNINPQDIVDVGNVEKIGVTSASCTYSAELFTLEAVVVPVFTPSRLPPMDSRWAGDLSETTAAFAPLTPRFGYAVRPHRTVANVQFAGQLSTSVLLQGWDLALSYYEGFQPVGVFRGAVAPPDVILERVFPKIRETGVGFSTTVGQFEIHGEGAYHDTRDNDKDDDYYEYIAGVNYTMDGPPFEFMETVTFVAEYIHEDKRRRKPPRNEYTGTGDYLRPFPDTVVGKVIVKFSEETKLEVSAVRNLGDDDSFIQPRLTHKFTDNTKVEAGVDIISGKSDTFFGRWSNNDRAYVILTQYF